MQRCDADACTCSNPMKVSRVCDGNGEKTKRGERQFEILSIAKHDRMRAWGWSR
jgi:hypothetical protein